MSIPTPNSSAKRRDFSKVWFLVIPVVIAVAAGLYMSNRAVASRQLADRRTIVLQQMGADPLTCHLDSEYHADHGNVYIFTTDPKTVADMAKRHNWAPVPSMTNGFAPGSIAEITALDPQVQTDIDFKSAGVTFYIDQRSPRLFSAFFDKSSNHLVVNVKSY
jgi:hypothetical protein